MTCEYHQINGWTALLWASVYGHADTARVLVELGASVEAVDKVNIHAHALANTCFMKDVFVLMRMTIAMISFMCAYRFMCVDVYIYSWNICMHIYIYIYIYMSIYNPLFFLLPFFIIYIDMHILIYFST